MEPPACFHFMSKFKYQKSINILKFCFSVQVPYIFLIQPYFCNKFSFVNLYV